MKERRKREYPEKIHEDQLQKMPHTTKAPIENRTRISALVAGVCEESVKPSLRDSVKDAMTQVREIYVLTTTGKFHAMIGTLLFVFGSRERHSKLTESGRPKYLIQKATQLNLARQERVKISLEERICFFISFFVSSWLPNFPVTCNGIVVVVVCCLLNVPATY